MGPKNGEGGGIVAELLADAPDVELQGCCGAGDSGVAWKQVGLVDMD